MPTGCARRVRRSRTLLFALATLRASSPPVSVISCTATRLRRVFTGYQAAGFGDNDQERLRDAANAWRRSGAKVVLSNADTPAMRKLYGGFRVRRQRLRDPSTPREQVEAMPQSSSSPASSGSRANRRGRTPGTIRPNRWNRGNRSNAPTRVCQSSIPAESSRRSSSATIPSAARARAEDVSSDFRTRCLKRSNAAWAWTSAVLS